MEAAKEVALRLYYEVDARIQNKLPATTRKFKDVARHAIQRMEAELEQGVGKQAYRDYIQVLNNLPQLRDNIFRPRSFVRHWWSSVS